MAGLRIAVASAGTLGKLTHTAGAAFKTVAELTNNGDSPIYVRFFISFFGTSASDPKAVVRLTRSATPATGTPAGTSPTVVKLSPTDAGTINVTAREGFTVEPTTTNEKVLQQAGVHLQSGWNFATVPVEPGDVVSLKVLHASVSPDYTWFAQVEE